MFRRGKKAARNLSINDSSVRSIPLPDVLARADSDQQSANLGGATTDSDITTMFLKFELLPMSNGRWMLHAVALLALLFAACVRVSEHATGPHTARVPQSPTRNRLICSSLTSAY